MASSSPARDQSEPLRVPDQEAGTIHLLRIIHLLRSAGGDLLAQAALHGRLAELEWIGQKRRLAEMVVALLVAAAALFSAMAFTSVMVLALSWDTDYRVSVVFGLIALHAVTLGLAWRKLSAVSSEGSAGFAASRAELQADLDLLKPRL